MWKKKNPVTKKPNTHANM